MKRFPSFACLLGLMACAQPLFSQTHCQLHVSGYLSDTREGMPLPYAELYIEELGKGIVSDSAGHFHLDKLCPGDYVLKCSHISCEPKVFHLHLAGDTALYWVLVTADPTLETVHIAGKKAAPVLASQQQLSVRQMEQQAGKSLGDMLGQLSGVSNLHTGATISKPVIHGLHSSRVVILNNGIRQEGQQWGSEHAPEIDPLLATHLTVVKGASAVRYGSGAIGGVILVEPAPLRDSAGVGGRISLGGFSNGRQGLVSGSLEGKFAHIPLAWRIQGTLKRAGNLRTPGYFLENTGMSEANGSATLAWRELNRGMELFYSQFHTQLGIFSASHLGSSRELEQAFSLETPAGADTTRFTYAIGRPLQAVQHHLVKWQGYLRPDPFSKITLTYAFQYNRRLEFDKHKPRGAAPNGDLIPELTFRIFTHTLEAAWTREYQDWTTSIGVFGLYQNNALDGRQFIPNFIAVGAEAFAIARRKIGSRLEAELGTRYDYRWVYSAREEQGIDIYSQQWYQSISGTAGLVWHPARKWEVQLNSGSAWRPPNVNELFSNGLHHGSASFESGDSTLLPEQALKTLLSISHTGRLSGSLTLYHQHFFRFIYLRPDGLRTTIRGTFPAFRYDQTAALIAGADLDLNFAISPALSWAGKAAWLYAQNLTDATALIFMPANWFENSLSYEWKTIRQSRFYLSIGIRHTFEQTRVPEGVDFIPPPPAYTLLNAHAGASKALHKGLISLTLGCDNLLDTAYRDYLDRFRYFADAPGRNMSANLTYTF